MQEEITDIKIEHHTYKWQGQTYFCTNVTYLRNGRKNSARYEGHMALPFVKLQLGVKN